VGAITIAVSKAHLEDEEPSIRLMKGPMWRTVVNG